MKKWTIFLSLTLSYLIFSLLLNSIGIVIMQVIHHYDISKHHASILEGFKDLPIALVSFLAASFLPGLGYSKALQTGLFLTMLACLTMPVFPGFLSTKILFFTVGLSFALVKITIYANIGLIAENKNQHASMINLLEGFFMLGVLAGYWLFSLFINDKQTGNLDWLRIYWWISGLCALNILLFRFIQLPDSKQPCPNSAIQGFNQIRKLIAHPLVIIFMFASFLYVLVEQSISTWLPTFNAEVFNFPKSMSVQAASIFVASLVVGRFLSSFLLKKVHWHFLLSTCLIASAILVFLSLSLPHNMHTFSEVTWKNASLPVYLLPMTGLFIAPVYPVISSIMLSSLPVSQHAAMTGLMILFSALGGTAGSILTGNLFSHGGGAYAFYALLIPLMFLFFTFYRFKRFVD